MTRVAVASSSALSAEAGARIAEAGGNAVDAAVAASLVSLTTEPGVVSIGGGGFATIWPAESDPVTIDGNVETPGRGLARERFGQGLREARLDYGGGVTTFVGHGSVATPGALAALGLASQRYGRLPWQVLVEPALDLARSGFPLPQASYDYLVHSHAVIYGWHPLSHAALHDDDGKLLDCGDRVQVAALADSLEAIGRDGIDAFYRGDLAALIADDSEANDGVLTRRDLAEYQPLVRNPLELDVGHWRLATNPPPAVGGVTLAAMLTLALREPPSDFSAQDIARVVRQQASVLSYRRETLDLTTDVALEARRLLDLCASGARDNADRSGSTVHASAVDDAGLGCGITMSSGYGAGVIPPGTGIWMNNCLGELELNRRGLMVDPPGTRLSSNMAPCVARNDRGDVLAIGSPGADRITTALQQTLIHFVLRGLSLQEAIEHARVHVEFVDDDARAAAEDGLDTTAVDLPVRDFAARSMFFGGVGATLYRPDGGFELGADPRRSGGTSLAGR